MTNLTTPTIGYDRHDDRWVIEGDRLDFGGALRVLRRHMSFDDARDALMTARPSSPARETSECQTVTVPEAAEWMSNQGAAEFYSAPGDLYPTVRIEVPSEDAARALVAAAQAEAHRWGLVL